MIRLRPTAAQPVRLHRMVKGVRISPDPSRLSGVLGLLLWCSSVASCARPPVITAAPAALQRRFGATNQPRGGAVRGTLQGHLRLEKNHLTVVVTEGEVFSARSLLTLHLTVEIHRCPPSGRRVARSKPQRLGPFRAAEPRRLQDSMVYTIQLPPGLDLTRSFVAFDLRGEDLGGYIGGWIWERQALNGSPLDSSCRPGFDRWYVEPSAAIPGGRRHDGD